MVTGEGYESKLSTLTMRVISPRNRYQCIGRTPPVRITRSEDRDDRTNVSEESTLVVLGTDSIRPLE